MSIFSQVEGVVAVRDTIHNLNRPLFQDYSYQGRIVGFFLRLARIGAGIFVYAVVGLLFVLGYFLWLIFPLLCSITIIGSLLGTKSL